MRRLLLFASLLFFFAFAWSFLDVINIRVVGQPSMTGPIQSKLEQPFFESLQKETGLPLKVDYRTVDSLGFKDNYQLSMLKEGLFDMVSLRFLQNGEEEPSIYGVDLPGLNANFEIARKIGNAYGSVIDENLQRNFGAKLLGIWAFGPQVVFCNRPIKSLDELKGLRVRIGGSTMSSLIKSKGGIPVIIPFDQVGVALDLKIVECAITSEISAYSAKWPAHLSHVYPIATSMGLNGIAIRLETWNELTPDQQLRLTSAVDAYINETWLYAHRLRLEANDCIQGKDSCVLGVKYNLVVSPVTKDDLAFMQDFALNYSFPAWAERCNRASSNCGAQWWKIVEPLVKQANQ